MALFIKKGIDKAAGKPIYPHPNQTETGNCAAYTGAACFYAFGLDHEPKLLPHPTDEAETTKEKLFDYQIGKLVEDLTTLIYTDWFPSPAEGYRKYINKVGLNCKFDVKEVPIVKYIFSPAANRFVWITNLPYLKEQLERCQDIMLHIKYGGGWFPDKHSVGLVGFDEATGELILNNPWGGSTFADPETAAKNTEEGKTKNAFRRYQYTIDPDSAELQFPFVGTTATVYEVIMICPVEKHEIAVLWRLLRYQRWFKLSPALRDCNHFEDTNIR
jgi:hypothetical protein